MNVRGLSCPLRHRKFITLLISLEEHMFLTGELMLEVRIQDIHTTILHYINNIILGFSIILIILFVFTGTYFYVDASSNSKVPSVDLEDFRRTLISN
jgi:hypothetical protein